MNKLQKIVLGITALLCSTIIVFVFVTRPKVDVMTGTCTSLYFDEKAKKGEPKITNMAEHYSTLEIPLTSEKCAVSLAATPELDGRELNVKFTNAAENTVWLKLAVFDDYDNVIGESGIIKNGEYVESVKLEGTASVGQQIKAKILTYDTETYYSLGSAQVELIIK